MKNILVISLLLVGALVNCSKNKDGGGGVPGTGLPALNDTQKQKVASVNTSMADVAVITDDKNGGTTMPIKVSRKALTKTQEELNQKMDWAQTNNFCIPNVQVSGGQDQNSPSLISFEIIGSQCPINYTSKTQTTPSMSQGGGSIAVDMNEKFFVNPQGVLDLGLDITAYTITGKANMAVSGNQSSVNMSMNMSGKMNIASKQHGNVISDLSAQMTSNMNVDSYGSITSQKTNMAMTITQSFADFKVVAYVVASGSVTADGQVTENTSYYINGQQVSAEEFISIIGEVEMNADVNSYIH
ncbi:hypothetical protein K2X05_14855 [bacterium]|nr:hypothetical protein [bacterium]